MIVLSYPSSDFPGQPALRVTLPEGWQAMPQTGFVLAAGGIVEPGAFTPNVLISINRHPHGAGLARTKAEIKARCSTLADFALANEHDYLAQGLPVYRIAFAYRDPRAGTLLQTGRTIVLDYGHVEDVIQITSSCTGDQAEKFAPEIQAIEDSLVVNPSNT